jgi:hypothetical protein
MTGLGWDGRYLGGTESSYVPDTPPTSNVRVCSRPGAAVLGEAERPQPDEGTTARFAGVAAPPPAHDAAPAATTTQHTPTTSRTTTRPDPVYSATRRGIGSQGRGACNASPVPHPPFELCVQFSRTQLTDGRLDMVTLPSGIG